MVATSLCPVGRLVCSEPCTGLLSIQRSSNEHYKHNEKEKTKRQPKRSQDNGYSTKGTQISSAYSFVILAILFAAPFHRSSKWLAARCLMASRFLVFFLFGVVLASLRPFSPQFSQVDSKAVQRSALCRSRRELSNEYLLAKFGFDTAENEPCKVCPLSAYRSPRSTGTRRKCRSIWPRLFCHRV